MKPITTIVVFEVPPAAVEQFLSDWRENDQLMRQQAGLIDGIFYRCTDANCRFQFINIARWESEQALKAARAATHEAHMQRGVDRAADWDRSGIKLTPSIYREEVRY